MPRLVVLAVLVGVLGIPRAADARPRGRDITIEIPGERPMNNKLLVGGLAGGGLLVGALGLYFHLDSRTASDDVSSQKLTGRAWTTTAQALADRADRSATRAGVAYGIGGALVVAAIVTWIATEPASTTEVIHTGPAPAFIPTKEGAALGGSWTWSW
jgi:hypothetical protein